MKIRKIFISTLIIILCLNLIYTQDNINNTGDSLINTDKQDLKSKLINYVKTSKNYVFNIFEGAENYIIRLHQHIIKDLNVEYPFDLILFSGFGFLAYFLSSLLKFKKDYVYNYPDQPDLASLLNNKFKELTSLAKSVQVPTKPESQLDKGLAIDSNESVKQLKDRIDHLNSEVNNLQSEISINFSRLDEYLKTISSSQVDISNFLGGEANGETPFSNDNA